jgi:beta-lactamase regulating signal transducer with metallopeptidase domain
MTAAAIVSVLLEVSWRAVLVAALVGGVLLLWRVKGGAARHAAWTTVMCAMLLMPALVAVAPEWQLPVRMPVMAAAPAWSSTADIEVQRTDREVPAQSVANDAPSTRTVAGRVDATGVQAVVSPSEPSGAPTGTEWPRLVLLVWIVGIVINLGVLAMGWRMARRLVRGARTSEIDPRVLESPSVSAPCAVGVWRVRVVVPRVWRTWSRAGRDAVLQHEFAHVQRRDLLVAFLTRLNRAVFWFNPLAWWLERRIAAAAEQACDEAVLSSGQDPQRYAAVLVEMAGALRSGGGRVAWQSIGMVDGGDLESRVDRVLTGDVPRLSRWRVAGVLGMSSAALVVAVACQQAPKPLMPNPEVTKEITDYQAREAKWKADKALTLDQATALVKTFAETNDRSVAQSLLTFYMDRGQALMGWNEMVAARRPLLLTLIERHPESGITRWPLEPRFDPTGWAAAKDLWLAHVAKPDVTPTVLGNAATFFYRAEPERAEQLLLRAITQDPNGPQPRVSNGMYNPSWVSRLGNLYASVILGTTVDNDNTRVIEVSRDVASSTVATHARQTLEQSTDARLLAAAGVAFLTEVTSAEGPDDLSQSVGFDVVALGRGYLQRAVTIDPSMTAMAAYLGRFDEQRKYRQLVTSLEGQLGRYLRDATPAKVAELPVDVQMDLIPRLAELAYSSSFCADCYKDDPGGPARKRMETRAYATAGMALAAERPNDPRAGRLRLTAALAYGGLAMHDGDRAGAVRHLADAESILRTTPPGTGGMNYQYLLHALLDAGERETVAEFYDALALHSDTEASNSFTNAAAAIRNGYMPANYQRMRGRPVTAN